MKKIKIILVVIMILTILKETSKITESFFVNSKGLSEYTGALNIDDFPVIEINPIQDLNITYEINNGEVMITDYSPPIKLTEVNIPSTIEGLPVTSISSSVFYSNNISSISIPNSVTSIAEDAFSSLCTSLTAIKVDSNNPVYSDIDGVLFNKDKSEIVKYPYGKIAADYDIPNSVINIKNSAFKYCENLYSVTIPSSVTSIEYNAFNFNQYIASIDVDEDNQYYSDINGVLFNKDKTVIIRYPSGIKPTDYMIPDSVNIIADNSFLSAQLNSILIPNSVTSIGYSAFKLSGLNSVIIPNSVTSIAKSAFSLCFALKSITVDENNIYYSSSDGVLFNKDKSMLIQCPSGIVAESYVIPDSVNIIGDCAFLECYKMVSITIPNSVVYIGDEAFSDCNGLTSITLPNSITGIGDEAFYQCFSLTSIIIPDSVTSIGKYAFRGCSKLTSVNIPDSITNISANLFTGCAKLTSITLPDSVQSIGHEAFYCCWSLESITIPKSVTSIGDDILDFCSDDLTIYGYANTTAEKYALDNEYKFIVLYYAETTTTTEIPPVIYGDVNCDGIVDIRDVTKLNQYILKLSVLTQQAFENSDVIHDELVDLKDLVQLKKYIVKIISNLNPIS